MSIMFGLLMMLILAGALVALFAAAMGLVLICKGILERRRESAK